MFTVKGERYYNDYTRKNFEESFSSLEDIFQWLAKKSGNFNGDYCNDLYPIIRYGEKVDIRRISVSDATSRGWQYWIYEISTPEGIVFSTGSTTNGHQFCAKKIEEWLKDCNRRMKELKEKPNFVELGGHEKRITIQETAVCRKLIKKRFTVEEIDRIRHLKDQFKNLDISSSDLSLLCEFIDAFVY